MIYKYSISFECAIKPSANSKVPYSGIKIKMGQELTTELLNSAGASSNLRT